ncbi:hypothetical protein SH580_03435 [Coraliomargarita algicola]|uniref:Uncharacterized protein n=1 Tax=Coraliomargarita algicola TaxID=3092156 RepID=A0ABZ0RPD4_9BACT|nr:hypothetical protein [Coraliomargarita sp. J2-16]WPJ96757.1 hypothetical protein SH580_03435 [Coraliomargarita sp. J2-16]
MPASDTSVRLYIQPGGLLHLGEAAVISANVSGEITICSGLAGGFGVVSTRHVASGESWSWTAEACGQYVVEFKPTGSGEVLSRPLAVVDREWAVCQITVGAFTSEDFADLIHEARVGADYYINLTGGARGPAFSAIDPRWTEYERLHGDVIHPHVMASDVGKVDPELAHEDPNWETLSQAEIEKRLQGLKQWWQGQGYEPLDRIATYTPCNPLVQACRAMGIRVIHSLCAEQNWSDGEWAINHWGMPTAPYWMAEDDFRKAGVRDETGVMGIIMNHYQVLLPHLTHWGDFVLSPSHFTRWVRAADSGEESTRFRQFLQDTVRGGSPVGDAPFFFVAGFEFGRTFGTANMTAYNRAGLRRLLELAATEKLVFATSTDVRAYYDRHVPALPERLFRQRDNWVGVTVNGKPGQAGDAVVLERSAYKALIREDSALPYFYYDYTQPWHFATADIDAPDDYAEACRGELSVLVTDGQLCVTAKQALERATPIAVWDAELSDAGPFEPLPIKALDDGRSVTVLEVPRGWSGRCDLSLRTAKPASPSRRDGRWMLQSFGVGEQQHCYLHLDAALTQSVEFSVQLKQAARVDDAKGSLGVLEAGTHQLAFGPLQGWYRFWGCSVEDIEPAESVEAEIEASGVSVSENAAAQSDAHFGQLDAQAWAHPALQGKSRVLTVHCGAKLPFGTRSRAAADDEVLAHLPGIHASEFADGVMAFGPGQAFWYHPRSLHFRIYGLGDSMKTGARWTLLLHSFDPQHLDVNYRLSVGAQERPVGRWAGPENAGDGSAFYPIEFTADDLDARGRLLVSVYSDQKALVHWWRERGFIAAVHALWVGTVPLE